MRDWGQILAHAVTPAPQSVLEVGCNIGRNLLALRHFVPELHGIEPNPRPRAIARGLPELTGARIAEGDGFALPYRAEERSVGNECVSMCRYRLWPYPYKNKHTHRKLSTQY